MELFNYLLKVSACSALFFAFYLIVLRKLTFFKINRFYLLGSLVISFIIPALEFTIEREVQQTVFVNEPLIQQDVDFVNSTVDAPILLNTTPAEQVVEQFNWLTLLPYLYEAIVAFLLMLAVWRIVKLIKHTKYSVKEINGLKLVAKGKGFTNCSFFNYVFIDKNSLTESELAVLLAHEEVHAKQYHSLDKLVLIIAKAVLWFNPVIYLIDKALEQAHEYEADEATSQNIGTEPYANLLLKLVVSKSSNPLIHNFVKSPIKQRIKMLFNSKSKNMKKLAYLFALPIGLGLIWGFTIDVVNVLPSANQKKEFTLVIDAGHGGKDKGATINGVSEKEITLSMSKKLKELAEQKGIEVITTRTNDTYSSLQERVKTEGSFLISLHVNAQPKGNNLNGIEIFIPRITNNAKTTEDVVKMSRSIDMTYNLFESMKSIKGIAISNEPKQASLYLLANSKSPALLLELGFLTNKKDFQFITNDKKQDELAKAIIDGVLDFKKSAKTGVEMKTMEQDTSKGKTITGKIKSFEKSSLGDVLNLQVGSAIMRINSYNFKDKVKIGDEISVLIAGRSSAPPLPLPTVSVTTIDAKGNKSVRTEKSSYMALKVIEANGKLIYESPRYAFGYEANRARYASSTIKSIEKDANGSIKKIVLFDKEFTINLNVTDQQFKSNDFKNGDLVEVKFIGEKLTGAKTYTTNKMIALYSRPKKHALINKTLYPKFYYENGRQKVNDKVGK